MENQDHEHLVHEMMRKGRRVAVDPADRTSFYELGRSSAAQFTNGNTDRHPLTTERRLLKRTRTAQEYLDAQFGFWERLREYINASC